MARVAFAAAAVSLTGAAGEYILDDATRRSLESAALRIGGAADAFQLAQRGDFAGAARRLVPITEGVLDRSTRVFLLDAANVFESATGIGQDIAAGRYASAAFRLEREVSMDGGEHWLPDVSFTYNRIAE